MNVFSDSRTILSWLDLILAEVMLITSKCIYSAFSIQDIYATLSLDGNTIYFSFSVLMNCFKLLMDLQ